MTTRSEVRRLAVDVGEFLGRHDSGRDLAEFKQYADDPLRFMREVLRWDPWEAQEEITESVLRHPLTAVRSANSIGKDALAARLAIWWAVCRGGLVICTGPTQRQIRGIVFGEVRRAWSGTDLPGELFEQELRIDRETGAGIVGFTSTEVGALTGFHAENVLGCITEAQSCEPFVFEALMSCAVGGNDRLLALGNPLHPSGEFFTISQPGSGWNAIRIPASRHPNVVTGETVIPGGITRAFVERMRNRYGESSPIYRSRVEAEFPSEGEFGLVSREWLERSAARHEANTKAGFIEGVYEPIVAVDPARHGPDQTVVATIIGPMLTRLTTWGKLDTMQSTGMVIDECRRAGVRPSQEREGEHGRQVLFEESLRGSHGRSRLDARGTIVVDEVGVGSGIFDRLVEQGYKVIGFNGGRSARNGRQFQNLRAESYWTLKELLENDEVAIPHDEQLWQELVSINWRPSSSGKIQLEAKDDLRSRLGRSTDRSDAVSMGFWYAQVVGGRRDLSGWPVVR